MWGLRLLPLDHAIQTHQKVAEMINKFMADFSSRAKKVLHHVIFGFVSLQKGCGEHSRDVKMQQLTWIGVNLLYEAFLKIGGYRDIFCLEDRSVWLNSLMSLKCHLKLHWKIFAVVWLMIFATFKSLFILRTKCKNTIINIVSYFCWPFGSCVAVKCRQTEIESEKNSMTHSALSAMPRAEY